MAHTFTCETDIEGVEPDVVFDLCLDVDVHLQSMARCVNTSCRHRPGATWAPEIA